MDPFLINLNISIQWYLSSRLHRLVNLAVHQCTSPETTLTHRSGQPPMYPIQAMVWKDIGLERLPMPTSHLWQQLTLKSIKTMVLKGMNWQGFCAPAGDRVN